MSGFLSSGIVNATAIPDSGDLHARYDFTQEDGTTPVSDQTGNGYNLDSGGYTSINTNINNTQAGEFDGTDDVVYTSTSFSDITPLTFSLVIKPTATLDLDHVLQFNDGKDLVLRYFDGGNDWELGAWNDGLGIGGSSNKYTDEPVILTGVISDNSSEGLLREISDSKGTIENTGKTNNSSTEATDIMVGSREPNIDERYMPADYGEILIYPDIRSTTQISEIEDYLKNRWGISG